jgi:hypothetical protein
VNTGHFAPGDKNRLQIAHRVAQWRENFIIASDAARKQSLGQFAPLDCMGVPFCFRM